MAKMQNFTYTGEYITLGQLLKVVNLALSGGEAKAMLASGAVLVNEVCETRRGRKLRHGDIVQFGQDSWQLQSSSLQL